MFLISDCHDEQVGMSGFSCSTGTKTVSVALSS